MYLGNGFSLPISISFGTVASFLFVAGYKKKMIINMSLNAFGGVFEKDKRIWLIPT